MKKILATLGMLGGLWVTPTLANCNATANPPALTPGTQPCSMDLNGNLRTLTAQGAGGANGSVTAAGTNGTVAQAVQGITSGVPLPAVITNGGSSITTGNPAPFTSIPSAAPSVSTGLTTANTTVAAASLAAKSGATNLFGAYASGPSVAGFLLVFNATAAPADGTVTPFECVAVPLAGSGIITNAIAPEFLSTGLVLVFSTGTNCFTKTTSTGTAFLHAAYK